MFNYVIAALLVIVLALIPIMGYTAGDLDGLVIYLPMDEGKGNVAEDLSPLGVNDGKLIQDAKFVPNGKYGGAIELDGKGGSFVGMTPWMLGLTTSPQRFGSITMKGQMLEV